MADQQMKWFKGLVWFPVDVRVRCSCDDVRAAASRPLMDVGDLQGNGNERTQHHLQ